MKNGEAGRLAYSWQRQRTLVSRFWASVQKTTTCWIWIGRSKARKDGIEGYGCFSYRETAHRFSWRLHRGSIPRGKHVLHTCDNPPCVRPSHLFLGTRKINMQDASKKGRMAHGERHPGHKLTTAEVRLIRRRARRESCRRIAKDFPVHRVQIGRIVRGVSRKVA